MMKSNRIVFLVVLAGAFYFGMALHGAREKSLTQLRQAKQKVTAQQATKIEQNDESAAVATSREPASKVESVALVDMAKTLSQYTKPESRFQDLVGYLDRSGQKPFVVTNKNPYSGEMVVVRTKSPLKDTRYFHAQYFTDESDQRFVQHMSFEYKSSPTAMRDAVNAIKDAFPQLPKPDTVRADYARWSLKDQGYIVWVKKMTADDLKDDPFNAYSPNDIGTVRVAIESEVHGEDDHSH